MQISGVGSQAAIDYAQNAPPALKPQATREAAQVLTLRKAIDTESQIALDLVSTIRDLGSKIDVTG